MKQTNTTQDLIDALENSGYEWRAYSGRGMYGAQCVGVIVEDDSILWQMARDLIDIEIAAPRTDSMGRDIILYWPRFKIVDDAVSAKAAS
jgi:hypothetical protein